MSFSPNLKSDSHSLEGLSNVIESINQEGSAPQAKISLKEIATDLYAISEAFISLKKCISDIEVSEDNTCCICLAPYKQGEGKRTLGCEHSFHKKCIDKWLTTSKTECPICRKNPFD